MKIETQNQKIFAYLKSGKSITSIEALNLFGCFRLSARIYDIKRKYNVKINKVILTSEAKNFAKYYMSND